MKSIIPFMLAACVAFAVSAQYSTVMRNAIVEYAGGLQLIETDMAGGIAVANLMSAGHTVALIEDNYVVDNRYGYAGIGSQMTSIIPLTSQAWMRVFISCMSLQVKASSQKRFMSSISFQMSVLLVFQNTAV